MTFEELYRTMLKQAVEKGSVQADDLEASAGHLDCLLHPQDHPLVWPLNPCTCPKEETHCAAACLFDAIVRRDDGTLAVDPDRCSGCGACIQACQSGNLTASRDVLPALDAVKHAKGPVYALIAPAFLGQFSTVVTPGRLRSAFKLLGFTGMVEVALFADLLTLKEALEFDRNIHTETDFQLTSCCCPMWIGMIRKLYHELMPHVPGAVSPMIAAGRTVKKLHPDAVTIFVGPCIAKKAEAGRQTWPARWTMCLPSRRCRIFSRRRISTGAAGGERAGPLLPSGADLRRTGGVSEAVRTTVARLHPERPIQVRTRQADGVPACRAMIEDIRSGQHQANFFEGMGCTGGCVGGPKVLLDRETGRENVDRYGDEAEFSTPLDNPYVLKLLRLLGFDTVEEFLEQSDIFIRHF